MLTETVMPPPLITHLSQYAAENTVSTVLVVQHSCAVFSALHVIYFVFSFKLLFVIKAPLMFFVHILKMTYCSLDVCWSWGGRCKILCH